MNFTALRESVELRRIVENDMGPPLKGGRWACPIHGGEAANFAVAGDRWKCWKCGASGDVVDYVARRENITVAEAARRLDPSGSFVSKKAAPRAPSAVRPPAPAPDRPPVAAAAWEDPAWQAAVDRIVRRAEALLWSSGGRPALDWLRRRGLADPTIRRFRLGFLAAPVESEPLDVLGRDDRGEPRRVRSSRGVVIPWVRPGSGYASAADDDESGEPGPRWIGGNVRRLPTGDLADPLPDGTAKYRALAGSERGHGYPWPEASAPGAPALVCEGEFDALIGWQEAGWIANVVTFGGAGQSRLPPDARAYLAACPDWLLLFDADDAGDQAAAALMRRAPQRGRRLYLPPGFNDLTDMHTSGVSIPEWLSTEYARFGWPQPLARAACLAVAPPRLTPPDPGAPADVRRVERDV